MRPSGFDETVLRAVRDGGAELWIVCLLAHGRGYPNAMPHDVAKSAGRLEDAGLAAVSRRTGHDVLMITQTGRETVEAMDRAAREVR